MGQREEGKRPEIRGQRSEVGGTREEGKRPEVRDQRSEVGGQSATLTAYKRAGGRKAGS